MTRKDMEEQLAGLTPEGFNAFISAMRAARKAGELTALDASVLLSQAAQKGRAELREAALSPDGIPEGTRSRLTMHAKTAAACMLVLKETRARRQLSDMALLFLEYAAVLVRSSYDLAGTAVKAASYAISDVGFSWTSIENATSADMLAYQFCHKSRMDTSSPLEGTVLTGKGMVDLRGGLLRVTTAPSWDLSVRSFAAAGGCVSVETRNSRDEKLKQSDADDVQRIDDFARTFTEAQESALRTRRSSAPVLRQGGRYAVSVIAYEHYDEDQEIECRIVGMGDDVRGTIADEELVKGLYVRDLLPYLCDGDCIRDAVLLEAGDVPEFSIREAYKAFAAEAASRDSTYRTVFTGKVVDFFRGATSDKDRAIVMSANGYGCLMRDKGTYKAGDMGTFTVIGVQRLGDETYINVDEPDFYYEEAVPFSEDDVLYGRFTVSEEEASRSSVPEGERVEDAMASERLRSLAAILSRVRDVTSMERLRCLLAASFIWNAAGGAEQLRWTEARAEYLRICISFAQGKEARVPADGLPFSRKESEALSALPLASMKCDVREASRSVASYEEGSVAGKIAEAVLAHSLSRDLDGAVSFSEEDMRSMICSALGVADQHRESAGKGGGKYGRGELDNVEFKSSYVMRNDGRGPDLDYQGRGQVFEAVCGMLNRDGGMVYIGVNNSGDPVSGPRYGTEGDLAWFRENFDTVKLTRAPMYGHPFKMPEDLDSYCIFLNLERDLYFRPSVRKNITITPTEDYDAIVIKVRPAEFEIARLYRDSRKGEGTAYCRDGQETLPMSTAEQQKRLMRLRSVGKVERFIVALTEAIDRQSKVILKGYASSNSNQVRDRHVVPINLACNDENLWAYDLGTRECREFRLARTADIEVLDERYPHAYPPGQADVFRWINPKLNYHVKLKLSVSAYNTLVENFANARTLPPEELYQTSPERWILDTHVHGWGAVVRFYIGNCGGDKKDIEILGTEDSDALRDEIRRYRDSVTV